MARRIQTRGGLSRNRKSLSGMGSVGADDLKIVVRDGLASMTPTDREAFILNLETDLRHANLTMRTYLFPLGVSASSPEELTPSDVGHLVRFLKFNVPSATLAVDGMMERLAVAAEKVAKPDERLAA